MEEEFFSAAYRGSKNFNQQEVRTANATGFGAAADDYAERGIDLNEQLIMNKPATFFFRMKGEAMTDAGIFEDDVLIVDRSIKVSNGKIIVAVVDGELLVRRYQQTFNKVVLVAENKKYKPLEIGEFNTYSIWGVVTCTIHVTEPSLQAFMQIRTKDNKSGR